MNNQPISIAGPTAVGKSAVAMELASRSGGEIISVDSMQVYRGMDIGTAKPTPEERERVPHHLIDVVDLRETFDAARFVELARAALADIQARGRVPVLCGGTGLYFEAFRRGLGAAPGSDPELRAELERTPLAELLDELKRKDPAIYEAMDRSNPRRVHRAVEVIRLTGKPYSAQRAPWGSEATATSNSPQESGPFFVLERDKPDLHDRINRRVDRMFREGLVAEVEQLLARGLGENRTALQALGYRQVVDFLKNGGSIEETIELVKRKTRQYAKRQMTWFKAQRSVTMLRVRPDDSVEAIAKALETHYLQQATIPT